MSLNAQGASELARVRLTLGERRYQILLRYFGRGWTHRRIALRMGITRQAVTRHIAEAVAAFPTLRRSARATRKGTRRLYRNASRVTPYQHA